MENNLDKNILCAVKIVPGYDKSEYQIMEVNTGTIIAKNEMDNVDLLCSLKNAFINMLDNEHKVEKVIIMMKDISDNKLRMIDVSVWVGMFIQAINPASVTRMSDGDSRIFVMGNAKSDNGDINFIGGC